MRSVSLALVLAVIVTLAGCATQRSAPLPTMAGWDERTEVLGEVRRWEFNGRIAVRTGDEGFNGKLRWYQNGRSFAASVSGPLGVGTVRLVGDQKRVTLTDNDGVRTTLNDIDADLRRRYGWTLPLSSLRYWALGIPDPQLPAETTFADDGSLQHLQQGDWSISIGRYRDGGGQSMPARITAENSLTRVRLVIDNWIFYA